MSPSQWHSLDSGIYARLGARGWELGVGSGAFPVHKRRSKQHNWFMDIATGAVGDLPTSPWHWPPLCRPNLMTPSENSLPSLWLRVFSGCLSLPGYGQKCWGFMPFSPRRSSSPMTDGRVEKISQFTCSFVGLTLKWKVYTVSQGSPETELPQR